MIEQDNMPHFVQPALDFNLTSPPSAVERYHEPSPAFLDLEAQRDAAIAHHRSGARAIAVRAFKALRAGLVTNEEYLGLFPVRDDTVDAQHRVPFEELSIERPRRPLDHAELAAGEGVHRVNDFDE